MCNFSKGGLEMGRSIYCCSCKKEKEPGRENESRCKKCKGDAVKARRARKRAEEGKEPYGTGRSLYCCRCKGLKEQRNRSYCYTCIRADYQESSLKSGKVTLYCACEKCDKLVRQEKHRKDAKKYRASENAFKDSVRHLTFHAIRKGVLKKMPCEVCKTEIDVQAHHDDYTKPLDVRWLCRKHHAEHHKNER
jgi:hypothetical protein